MRERKRQQLRIHIDTEGGEKGRVFPFAALGCGGRIARHDVSEFEN
ncbi:hypothetical protein EBESD8_11640 [Rhodococcus aetherivorans]|nr:hypothetical protein EBESD8_11640 [Rhodococcus aetherivorans]